VTIDKELMLDPNTLAEFSRTNCVSICTFLVPANLVATTVTITLTSLGRPPVKLWRSLLTASFFALLMVLHVYSWFAAGVVMAPTYILLALGITCLTANIAALAQRKFLVKFVVALKRKGLKSAKAQLQTLALAFRPTSKELN